MSIAQTLLKPCAVSTQPTCPGGPIAVHYDVGGHGGSCGSQGVPASMQASSTCNTDMYTGGGLEPGYQSLDLSYTPAPFTGGACTARATANDSNLTYTAHDTICTPSTEPCTSNGSGSDCTPSFGTGLQVCITASGNVQCPGTTFTQQHIVGGPATFTCSATCGCSLAGTCSGTLSLYTNGNCSGTPQNVPANGTCLPGSIFVSNTYDSYGYAPSPFTATCNDSGTSTPQNLALSNEQTVCCSP